MNEDRIPVEVRGSMWKQWWIRCSFVMLCWLGVQHQAQAQTPPNTAFQVQQFRPWADPQGIFQTQSGATLGQQWNYFVGVWFNYANDPLVERAGDQRLRILEHQLGLDILGAIAFFSWLDFGFNFPMTLYQVGTIPNLAVFDPADRNKSLTGFALSDFKLFVKAQALREDKHFINLAFQVYVGFPSGDQQKMGGEDGVSFGVRMNVSKRISRLNLGLNFGYRYLPPTTLANLKIQHELTYSLGGAIRVVRDYLDILVDVGGALAISDVTAATTAPLELYAGLRIFPLNNENLAITLGGSFAITPGYGSPFARALLGVVWAPKSRDKDGDGIVDKEDRCPTVPGPRENQGCPWGDKDGDGLKDNVDKCPDTPGPRENNGCPWGDRDGDGLKDNVDKCPDKPGPKENQGCPDTDRDKDGIVDRLDKCPDIPGLKKLQGCPPKVSVVFTKKEIKILQKIEFAFNKAVIRPRSYPILDQVVSVMKSRPELRVRVEGHTDNVGDKPYNLKLSKRRAASVMRYLISKGIARSRLTSEGYGETRPLVPNTTKENRARNRRVQFTVLYQGKGSNVQSTPDSP